MIIFLWRNIWNIQKALENIIMHTLTLNVHLNRWIIINTIQVSCISHSDLIILPFFPILNLVFIVRLIHPHVFVHFLHIFVFQMIIELCFAGFFSLSLAFSSLTMMYLGGVFFTFILPWVCWESWIYKLILFIKFGSFQLSLLQNFFCPFLFPSSPFKTQLHMCCKVWHCLLGHWGCLLFFHLFSSCSSNMISVDPSSGSLILSFDILNLLLSHLLFFISAFMLFIFRIFIWFIF